jgi:hypothetical protein
MQSFEVRHSDLVLIKEIIRGSRPSRVPGLQIPWALLGDGRVSLGAIVREREDFDFDCPGQNQPRHGSSSTSSLPHGTGNSLRHSTPRRHALLLKTFVVHQCCVNASLIGCAPHSGGAHLYVFRASMENGDLIREHLVPLPYPTSHCCTKDGVYERTCASVR